MARDYSMANFSGKYQASPVFLRGKKNCRWGPEAHVRHQNRGRRTVASGAPAERRIKSE